MVRRRKFRLRAFSFFVFSQKISILQKNSKNVSPMDVVITQEGASLVCSLRGRLDTPSSQGVMDAIQPLLEQADREIIVDCQELTYISSSGLRILLTLRKETARRGGRLIIRDISEAIRQVFLMTGFYNLFEIHES